MSAWRLPVPRAPPARPARLTPDLELAAIDLSDGITDLGEPLPTKQPCRTVFRSECADQRQRAVLGKLGRAAHTASASASVERPDLDAAPCW